ncbi:hypothetical protein J4204_00345 [Candidatus Woesearchaeota archaeon]|nr:hypothetical protein [Candidatus Woesearchaeota archaeon]
MLLKKITNRKLLFLIFVFIFMLSSVSYAQTCEVAKAKDVLRKNLYLYLTNPSLSPLALSEVKDLLSFYIGISSGLVTVDCSGQGSSSGKQFEDIINDGESAPDVIPACFDGTKYGECSATKPKFCYGGSLINKCNSCGCPSAKSCNTDGDCNPSANITCFSGLDCGNNQFTGNYYCNNSYVTKNYLNYTCINPGTSSSSCISSTNPVKLSYCNPSLNQTCVDGSAGCQVTAQDTTPPTISITTPTSGSNVSGSVTVSANASDNLGVSGVQFKLDGANLGAEDTAYPYSILWNTTTTTNGARILTAIAKDAVGNNATSSIIVAVSNP